MTGIDSIFPCLSLPIPAFPSSEIVVLDLGHYGNCQWLSVSTNFLLIFLFVNTIFVNSSKKCEFFSYLVIKFTSCSIRILISFNLLPNVIFWHETCCINTQILWKETMMNPAATELVLINSFIVLLIFIDAIIRIGSSTSDDFDPNWIFLLSLYVTEKTPSLFLHIQPLTAESPPYSRSTADSLCPSSR